MNYRLAGPQDHAAIAAYIADAEYFGPIDPDTLGGHWIIAEHDDEIRGTIWFFAEPPNAYVDYWCGKSIVAAKLGQLAEHYMAQNNVRYVRGNIQMQNTPAAHMATGRYTNMAAHFPYYLVYKDLASGQTENDASDDDTGSGSTGTEPSRILTATGQPASRATG